MLCCCCATFHAYLHIRTRACTNIFNSLHLHYHLHLYLHCLCYQYSRILLIRVDASTCCSFSQRIYCCLKGADILSFFFFFFFSLLSYNSLNFILLQQLLRIYIHIITVSVILLFSFASLRSNNK